MKISNINCRQYSTYGLCNSNRKPRNFGWFRPECVELKGEVCDEAERYPRPDVSPPGVRGQFTVVDGKSRNRPYK